MVLKFFLQIKSPYVDYNRVMKLKLLILTVFFLSTAIFSQEMKLYAPFPSRIDTENSGTNIIITWKDAKDVSEGMYEIYRAETAITADNLYLAEKIGDAGSGLQTYSDTPPTGIDLYYAVFAKDDSQTYKICIPYRNVTTSASRIEESDIEETKSATISQIEAVVYDTDVNLQFLSSLGDRDIIIFRNTSIIDNFVTLIKSVNISEESGSTINYIDKPMAGIDYYYAAVDGELYRSGSENLLYSGNYTTDKVQVKFSHQLEEDALYVKSTMPLPLLKVAADLESGALLNEKKDPESQGVISEENLLSISRLINKSSLTYKPVSPATLAYNNNINSIISGLFFANQWQQAADRLEVYTSLDYDEETRIQSHFYRGQSYFYLGLYNKALLEFIMIEKKLFIETDPFFQAIYRYKKTSL